MVVDAEVNGTNKTTRRSGWERCGQKTKRNEENFKKIKKQDLTTSALLEMSGYLTKQIYSVWD